MSTDRGLVAEHLAMAWVQAIQDDEHRVDLAICLGDCPADFLMRAVCRHPYEGTFKWQAVQVKRVYWKKDRLGRRYPTINLVKNGGRPYTMNDLDKVMAVDVENQNVWMLPAHIVVGKTRLRLASKHQPYWRVVRNSALADPLKGASYENVIAGRAD